MEDSKYDDTLFEILKEVKDPQSFLDTVFGFLKRRTDFYVQAKDENSPVGLPSGLASHIVQNTFNKWRHDELPTRLAKQTSHIKAGKKVDPSRLEFSSSESYNGAEYKTLAWSQTISEVHITLKVPEGIIKNNLSVLVTPASISIKVRDPEQVLLEGELCKKCKPSSVIWSLDRTKLSIHIDKVSEMWWDCLIQGEPKLDLREIDCSRPFEELSEEAQAKIEELTWNQERKRQGLPTSDELAMQAKLQRAWNEEGSPFSGPYDPSAVLFK